MASRQPPWLMRDLIEGPHLCLCTSQQQFDRVMRKFKIPSRDYLNPGADATCYHMNNEWNELVCVVCIRPAPLDPVTVCALLVHEAVHVFQEWCLTRGEHAPSREFEAHSIQSISQRLMTAYRKQAIYAL